MKYVGIYWTFFAPKIKKSIKKRFGNDLAEKSIENGKAEYRRLLSEADDLGKGNPMAMNAYFAYVFAAAGSVVAFSGRVGDDLLGRWLSRVAEKYGLDELSLQFDRKHDTTIFR